MKINLETYLLEVITLEYSTYFLKNFLFRENLKNPKLKILNRKETITNIENMPINNTNDGNNLFEAGRGRVVVFLILVLF